LHDYRHPCQGAVACLSTAARPKPARQSVTMTAFL